MGKKQKLGKMGGINLQVSLPTLSPDASVETWRI